MWHVQAHRVRQDASEGAERLILFNIFINSLIKETECILSEFAGDCNPGEVVDMLESKSAGQRNHLRDELEEWANRNLLKFNRDGCKVLRLGQKCPMPRYGGTISSPRELGVLTDTTPNICQQRGSCRNESQLSAGLPGEDWLFPSACAC